MIATANTTINTVKQSDKAHKPNDTLRKTKRSERDTEKGKKWKSLSKRQTDE